MPVVDTLEAGLATLEELDWDLGGYVLLDSNDIGIGFGDYRGGAASAVRIFYYLRRSGGWAIDETRF